MSHTDPRRTYRHYHTPGETTRQLVVEETDLAIVSAPDVTAVARACVYEVRGLLRAYIALHPAFATSHTPVELLPTAPPVAHTMTEAGARFGVGPMAAVAGTVAQAVVDAVLARGELPTPDILVENGGDVYCASIRARTIGLLTGAEAPMRLGVRVQADEFPVAFCASSGRLGHSASYGAADVVVVRSSASSAGPHAGAVADAAATALANRVRTADDLPAMLEQAQSWADRGVEGVFAMVDGRMAAWGRMELVEL